MKSKILNFFSSNVKISVTGRNVNNFIKRIIKNNINIVKLIPISYKEVHLIIEYNDLAKIEKYKTIYDIEIIKYYGKLRILKFINKNIYLLFSFFVSLLIIYTLSNIIFDINIVHSNQNIVHLIEKELNNHGIKKYSFAKNYYEIEKIKKEILDDNKDTLEWIEIIREGTKYTVRVEERILNNNVEDNKLYDIVASKSAVIKAIEASSGEKIKSPNTYVKKGEVIISSDVTLPNNEKVAVGAHGKVIGEVWYKVDIEYPYNYHEISYTGKKKKVLVFNFANKRISFFDFHKYKNFEKDTKVIFENLYIPMSLTYEYQYETNVIDNIYTYNEAKDKAIIKAKERLTEKYSNISKINDVKILKEKDQTSHIFLSLFIICDEDITEYREVINDTEDNDSASF